MELILLGGGVLSFLSQGGVGWGERVYTPGGLNKSLYQFVQYAVRKLRNCYLYQIPVFLSP